MDIYETALNVAKKLRLEGHVELGQSVEQAIEAGSTSSEILMRLRYSLLQVKNSEVSLTPESSQGIEDLVKSINRLI